MPEVPEHLLQRSRERRAALTGADVPGSASGEGAPAAATPATTGESAPAQAAAATPAVIEEPAAPAGPDPVVLKLQEANQRRIPTWVFPALVALPFWAILYLGAFGSHEGHAEAETPEQIGARVYAGQCASCHGGSGEGGAGPALAGGEATLTFPNEADHVQWVREGSQTKARGTPYGDPARPGGQRRVEAAGMPPFQGKISEEEIAAVVAYERGL